MPAPITSTFVVHTVEEPLQETARSLILSFVLDFETVLEEGSIGVTDPNYPAIFTVKQLIYIPNAVG